jgi:hypothetical protein
VANGSFEIATDQDEVTLKLDGRETEVTELTR